MNPFRIAVVICDGIFVFLSVFLSVYLVWNSLGYVCKTF